ncbi:unnamed protein product [Didymodactylos carnosus]|uniref:Uncharacterized protein n=1 Tax=Didymodactylos carnosus TaxID=1234261 RepID=A0A8S2NHV6_9BILA|nr:unnamed protein product [Didymodactylos carnosus]CAF4001676.1 unnamed protein product [Didymodactylos carnosus]
MSLPTEKLATGTETSAFTQTFTYNTLTESKKQIEDEIARLEIHQDDIKQALKSFIYDPNSSKQFLQQSQESLSIKKLELWYGSHHSYVVEPPHDEQRQEFERSFIDNFKPIIKLLKLKQINEIDELCISVGENTVTDEHAEIIHQFITDFNIKSLSLDSLDLQLGDKKLFNPAQNIQTLRCESCFPKHLTDCPSIKCLELDWIERTLEDCQILSKQMRYLTELTIRVGYDADRLDALLSVFPPSIKILRLNISLEEAETKVLGDFLSKNKTLLELYCVGRIMTTHQCYINLAYGLRHNSTLKSLDLSKCFYSSLPESIKIWANDGLTNNNSLEILNLNYNKMDIKYHSVRTHDKNDTLHIPS